jgi:hypothetical protein
MFLRPPALMQPKPTCHASKAQTSPKLDVHRILPQIAVCTPNCPTPLECPIPSSPLRQRLQEVYPWLQPGAIWPTGPPELPMEGAAPRPDRSAPGLRLPPSLTPDQQWCWQFSRFQRFASTPHLPCASKTHKRHRHLVRVEVNHDDLSNRGMMPRVRRQVV